MTPRSTHLKSALFAASLLSTSATAQNDTDNIVYDECDPNRPVGFEYVRGTGTANFSDLIVSVIFRDDRTKLEQSNKFDPLTIVSLSAPEDTKKQACVHMFLPLDGNRQGGGASGCEGVLLQKCADLIANKYSFPANPEEYQGESGDGYLCTRDFTPWKSEIDEACGPALLNGDAAYQLVSKNLKNTTCLDALDQPFERPDGYRTTEMQTWENDPYDELNDNFTMYDEYITRPIPIAVTTIEDGKVESKLVCIAPDDVREGNRVPADSVNKPGADDDESAAAGIAWARNTGMAVLMAGLAAMSFVLA